ncbi:hypothetical protein [Mucilaginibacter sp.]|uniref:hypothetical protein n=1 Tax=Mucilaginibacter sp. TaxID=1882438 RepID=UPI00261E1D2B|nr:hypothetical protein [Mucilaginibacter sp.]MDB4922817.1 hypothetical protein [Mucilaginibacter sp.]
MTQKLTEPDHFNKYMDNFPLKNWIPYKLVNINGQVECHWLDTFDQPFAEPFFDETILKYKTLKGKNGAIASISDLQLLNEWADNLPDVEPTAIIFHISRCGSTLVSQLLATSNECIVLPEVPFFDDLLRLPYQYPGFNADATSGLLKKALKYYGQKKLESEKRLYIKTDSWHIFFYEQLRWLYPTVPFVLMYRKPNEVFNSHKKLPGIQSVPGLIEPCVFGFKNGEETQCNLDEYLATVLEKYLGKYLQIIKNDNRSLLVNYNEGPMPVMQKIAAFTNTPLNNYSLSIMEERSRYNSKKPDEVFSEVAPINIPSCLDNAMELYYLLDEKRKNI